MAKKAPRTKNKDNARRSKKKTSVLVQESVDYIDYKDINLLRRFMSDRAKIRARRVTGNDAQQQREVARAIKNAREMALLPYTNRVTTQRTSRDRGPGGPGRADGPPPRPQGPPPSGGEDRGDDVGLDEVLDPVVLDIDGDGDSDSELVLEDLVGDLGDEQAPS
jgi:small subunit ribosomal protein S18